MDFERKCTKVFFLFVLIVSVFIWGNCYAKTSAEEAFKKGTDYVREGKYGQAIDQFTQAIKVNPTSASYSFRAYVYLLENKPDEAIRDCDKAIEIDPNNTQAYNNRAAAYQKKGDFDKSISDCTIGIAINPRVSFLYKNRAYAYFEKKQYDKSWDDVHRAEALEYTFDPKFIKKLARLSGRKK